MASAAARIPTKNTMKTETLISKKKKMEEQWKKHHDHPLEQQKNGRKMKPQTPSKEPFFSLSLQKNPPKKTKIRPPGGQKRPLKDPRALLILAGTNFISISSAGGLGTSSRGFRKGVIIVVVMKVSLGIYRF